MVIFVTSPSSFPKGKSGYVDGNKNAMGMKEDPAKLEQFYRDTESIAFPKIDDRQLSLLEPLGQRRTLKRGEVLYRIGQRDMGMTVILSGQIEVVALLDGEEQVLAVPGPRDFIGDVSMLTGTASLGS